METNLFLLGLPLNVALPASNIQASHLHLQPLTLHLTRPSHLNLNLHDLSQGKKTRAVRKGIVSSSRARVTALVEHLQIAGVDREGLVVGRSDQVTVANIVGPGSTTVSLAGERRGLVASLDGPLASEAVGGEGTEVAAVGALGLDDHEVLVLALKSVDLDGLEELLGSVRHDGLESSAEAAGELADGHAGAVDRAVVAAEEQVHVLGVTDDGLVDGASAGLDLAFEQRLSSGPRGGIGGIARGAVAEGSRAPLVGEDPSSLGFEVEQGRSNSSFGHGGLAGGAQLGEAGDSAKAHGAVLGRCIAEGGVDDVLAIDRSGGEVLERGPPIARLSEGLARSPLVGSRKGAGLRSNLGGRCCQQHGAGQQRVSLGLLRSHDGDKGLE
jgi:hypothetical protein